MRQVFDTTDVNKTGHIDSFDLNDLLKKLDINLSMNQLNELIMEFDKNGTAFKMKKIE
jgi:Ca2+-binding EF-hand superfamily protein